MNYDVPLIPAVAGVCVFTDLTGNWPASRTPPAARADVSLAPGGAADVDGSWTAAGPRPVLSAMIGIVDGRAPADGIRLHGRVIAALSDDELISRIARCEPLPDADDDDPAWLQDATWDRAEFLRAAADAIGDRQLVGAIGLVFQRAALGDGYEMMQGLRHGAERAVAQNWSLLAGIMRPLTRDRHGGCRRWAVRELGILRDPRALGELAEALSDVQPLVRSEACMSLGMLGQAVPDACPEIRALLQRAATADSSSEVRRHAQSALQRLTDLPPNTR